ncbi:hypothetical protein HRbin24_01813 [bacterium HR24]|nr:hypothetical protein HRbin24_01813 [bacterium HR24]
MPAEGVLHPLRLLPPQEAVVDEDAGELVAHGPVDQGGRHCRVHTAREGTEDAALAHRLPYALHRLGDEAPRRPVAPTATHPVQEVADDLLPQGRVGHLGVKLETEQARVVGHHCHRRVVRVRQGAEARRQLRHLVPVGHPDRERAGQPGEEGRGPVVHLQQGMAVFPSLRRRHAPAQLVGEKLHAVADAQHGQARGEHVIGGRRRAGLIDRSWAPREYEAAGREARHLLPGGAGWHQLAVDVALPHPAGDEHAILGAEVQDDHRLRAGSRRWRLRGRCLSLSLAGDLEVGRDLHVIGRGEAVAGGRAVLGHGRSFGSHASPATRTCQRPILVSSKPPGP